MPITNSIKFYPPPDNCDTCWKVRKKFFKDELAKMNLGFKKRELIIQVVGACTDEKKDKLKKFLVSELVKMNKRYVRVKFEQYKK